MRKSSYSLCGLKELLGRSLTKCIRRKDAAPSQKLSTKSVGLKLGLCLVTNRSARKTTSSLGDIVAFSARLRGDEA